MNRLTAPLLLMALVLAGPARAQSGTMRVDQADPKTGQLTQVKYSKYFDGADWLIPDVLGVSVVVDNDTPVSRQVFGGFTGKDSDAVGTVTVYFWNLGQELRKAAAITVEVGEGKLVHATEFQIGPGPNARTGHKAGTVPFFAYATTLKAVLTVEIEGQTIRREIPIARRTPAELKKYFGKKGLPPYPWFTEKYALKDDSPTPPKSDGKK